MNAPTKPVLTSQRIVLRDATPGDVEARFALGNTPEIQAMFGADPKQVRDITPEAAEAWVKNQMDEAHAWVIEAEGQLIGALRLHTLNPVDRRANIAIGILDKNALGKGYGTEAVHLLASHAFGAMGLHRLSCRVLSFNEAAIAAYEKLGFVAEGRERESALIGNEWHDDIIMGLLAQDLKAPR